MRKNIVLSMQTAELELLDYLAQRLGLTRSACVKLLVARYYKDENLKRFWQEIGQAEQPVEDAKAATFGRKVE